MNVLIAALIATVLQTEPDVPDLIRKLGSDIPQEREQAETDLLRAGKKAKPDLLAAKQTEQDPEILGRISRILLQLAYEEVLGREVAEKFLHADTGFPKLKVLMRHRSKIPDRVPDPETGMLIARDILDGIDADELRGRVAGEIAHFRLLPAARVLEILVKEGGYTSRASAIRALGMLRLMKEMVAPFLKDADPYLRTYAAMALGDMEAKEYAQDIADLLKSEIDETVKPFLRSTVIQTLGKLGQKEFAQVVAPFLEDKDAQVQASAIVALGLLQSEEHRGALIDKLKTKDDRIFAAAVKALGRLQAKDQIEPFHALLKHKDPQVLAATIEALGLMNDQDELPRILALVHHWQVPVQRAVVEFCRNLERKQVAAFLTDADPRLVAASTKILGRLGDSEYAAQIADGLKARHPNVSAASAEALGLLQLSEYKKPLEALLHDDKRINREWENLPMPDEERRVKDFVQRALRALEPDSD